MTESHKIPILGITPTQFKMIQHVLEKNVPMFEVWAFGSRVTGNVKPYSDLDLAIINQQPLSLEITANLTNDFSESDLPWKVDVVDWACTSEQFKEIIKKQFVVIQQSTP